MCGIAGQWRPGGNPEGVSSAVQSMTDALRHRGPDADGVWAEGSAGLALGHRRLAIVDLSPAGVQPMHSGSGRFTIVFNGEVYNFRVLRQELTDAGVRVEGSSDTAVMLAAFEHWGVAASTPRFNGMFAFAVWDARDRCLWLGRDRLGEKPLFIAQIAGGIAFASELKAFRVIPGFDAAVNPLAVSDVLRRGCTRGERTIYSAASKLLPGTLARFTMSPNGLTQDRHRYWSVPSALAASTDQPPFSSDPSAIDALDALLLSVVRDEMLADVPLGAFLSGGIDSSLIVALMQRVSTNRAKTFTIGFTEASHDESPYARAVAQHLGTEHTEIMLSSSDALAWVPRLPDVFDEPFADSSQLPTLLVSQVTRQHVTVALSGDGGDELFGGYSQYSGRGRLAELVSRIPAALRPALLLSAGLLPDAVLSRVDREIWPPNLRYRLRLLLGNGHDAVTAYDAMLSTIASPADVLTEPPVPSPPLSWPNAATNEESMMAFDLQTYLPDDILVKVDRSAMASSLETRAPLLDHRVVEFALAQPLFRKLRDGRGKFLLRELLYRYVPANLVDRPKQGFSIPLAEWLRRDLRAWGSDMLAHDALLKAWFKPKVISQLWSEHQQGFDRSGQLWPILVTMQWLRERQ